MKPMLQKPIVQLGAVVLLQLFLLASLIGFKQYTVITGETVLLEVQPVDPRDLLRGDYISVRYEISRIARTDPVWDDDAYGTVFVELQERDDGHWHAIAVHDNRTHTADGTVLIKGQSSNSTTGRIEYGIEDVFVPEGSGNDLPRGPVTVAVEVKVDRFGNAVPRRFFVDGEPFPLKRH